MVEAANDWLSKAGILRGSKFIGFQGFNFTNILQTAF